MMRSKNKDQQIINALKDMTTIKDHRHPDEIFNDISLNVNNRRSHTMNKRSENRKHARPKRFIPLFSFVLVVMIALIMIPSFISNNDRPQTLYDNEKLTNDVSSTAESTMPGTHNKEIVLEDNNDGGDQDNNTDEKVRSELITNKVVQKIDKNSRIIHAALTENQLQYVVPLSVIVPNNDSYNYNNLEIYLNESFIVSDWGFNEDDYPFTDVTYEINRDNKEVVMNLPADFSIGEGSARAHMFGELLSAMFTPENIEKVIFSESVDLGGKFGVIKELNLSQPKYVSYKLFQASAKQRAFLIPIPQDHHSVTDAFIDMQEDEDLYQVGATIPKGVTYNLEANDQQLIVSFSDVTSLTNNQTFVIMIEAMLMTAKSYGFENVLFKNTVNQLEQYDLTAPIPVPEAVNPIYLVQ